MELSAAGRSVDALNAEVRTLKAQVGEGNFATFPLLVSACPGGQGQARGLTRAAPASSARPMGAGADFPAACVACLMSGSRT